MHVAALPPPSLRHVHALICTRPTPLDSIRRPLILTPLIRQAAGLNPRNVRVLARVNPDEDSDEDLMDWEEDDDGLEIAEFDDVTITTDVEDNG